MGGQNPNRIYVEAPRPSYDDGPMLGEGESSGGFPGEPPPPRGTPRPASGGGGRRKRSVIWRMRRLLFVAGLLVMSLVAASVAMVANTELPDPTELQQSSLICDASVTEGCNGQNAFAKISDSEDRENVTLDKVPEILQQAVIDSEDSDFETHKGVNPVAISRALYWDLRSGTAVQGGSTITQQFVKNRFLTSEQTVSRKIKEALLAIKVEQSMSKDEILEGYLNTIFFGRHAYGIQAASQAYFGVDVTQVTELRQVAYLAGLIRAPNRADASKDPEAAKLQRTKVLVAMLAEGDITQEQYDATVDLPFDYVRDIETLKMNKTLKLTDKGGAYLTEYVKSAVENHPERYNLTETDINLGGLRIYTTINPGMQAAAWDAIYNPAVNTDYPLVGEDLPIGAMVSIDNGGNIRAMVGGRGDGTGTNFAVEGKGSDGRPVGSTFKPIVLAEAIRKNWSLDSMLPAPQKADIPSIEGCGEWHPRNAGESGDQTGLIDLVTATKQSVNTAYAELIYRLAEDNGGNTGGVLEMAELLGMDITDVNKCLPMVLGANNSSPLEMAEVYSTFMNQGVHKEPRLITRIERVDKKGNVGIVYEAQSTEKRVLGADQANLITHTLEQVIADGSTGWRADIGKPAAGKTGTTGDNKDAWFVGYTPGLTTAVWMGFEKPTDWVNPDCKDDASSGMTQEELEDEGSPYGKYAGHPEQCPIELAKMGTKGEGKPVYDWPQVIGGSIPAIIWKLYMTAATGDDQTAFTEPTEDQLRTGNRLEDGHYAVTTLPTDTSLPTNDPPGQPQGPPVTVSVPGWPTTTDPNNTTTSSSTTTTTTSGGPGGGGGGGRP
jgi:penicillin-binding protein 1A